MASTATGMANVARTRWRCSLATTAVGVFMPFGRERGGLASLMTRNRGDGSFSKLADGRWCFQVSLGLDDSGKRQRPRFYGATQAECRELAEEYRVKLRSGLDPARDESMTAYLTRWLAEREHALRPSTHRRYRQHVEQDILPTLGRLEVAEVTRRHVVRMVATIRARGASVRTANHAKNVLHSALQDALRDGLVLQNAAHLVKGLPQPRSLIQPLTAPEIDAIRSAVAGTREEALYGLALAYGLRQSELLGLTWADVDFKNGVLHVRHGLYDTHKGEPRYELAALKTESSRRDMAMPDHVRRLLEAQKVRQAEERLKAGSGWQRYWPDLVFRGRTGRPMDGHVVTRSFQHLQERLEIQPVRRFHDIRHSTATALLMAGVEMKVISDLLGHSTIAVTANTYSHVPRELQRDALDRLAPLWGA